MEDAWLSNKADEILCFAARIGMKNFYAGLREVCTWETSSGSSPLLSADGSTYLCQRQNLGMLGSAFQFCFKQTFIHHIRSNCLPPSTSNQYITGQPNYSCRYSTNQIDLSLVCYFGSLIIWNFNIHFFSKLHLMYSASLPVSLAVSSDG